MRAFVPFWCFCPAQERPPLFVLPGRPVAVGIPFFLSFRVCGEVPLNQHSSTIIIQHAGVSFQGNVVLSVSPKNHQQRRRSLTKPRATPYFILPPFSPVLEDVGLTSPDPTPFSAWDTCPFQTRGLIAPPLSTFLEFPNPPPGGRSFVGFPGALEFHFRAFGDLPVATGAKGHFMFPRVQQSFCPIV